MKATPFDFHDFDGVKDPEHRVTFAVVEGHVRQLGLSFALCSRSPNCAVPPFWGPVVDDASGRAELVRRIRVLFGAGIDAIHSDLRGQQIKHFVTRELVDVE